VGKSCVANGPHFFSPTPPQPRVRAVWGRKNAGGMPQGAELPFAGLWELPVDDCRLRAVLRDHSRQTISTSTERGFPMSFLGGGNSTSKKLRAENTKNPCETRDKTPIAATESPTNSADEAKFLSIPTECQN